MEIERAVLDALGLAALPDGSAGVVAHGVLRVSRHGRDQITIVAPIRYVDVEEVVPDYTWDKGHTHVHIDINVAHGLLYVSGVRHERDGQTQSGMRILRAYDHVTARDARGVLDGLLRGVQGRGPPRVYGPRLKQSSLPGLVEGSAAALAAGYREFLARQAEAVLAPCRGSHSDQSVDAMVPRVAEMIDETLRRARQAGEKRPRSSDSY